MRERALRIIRFIDWKFILVFTLMIMAMTVYYLVDTTTRQRDEALDLLAHKEDIAAVERKEARAERRIILTQLSDLQAKYDTSVKINRDFVAWLRAQGYRVPDEYILPENVRLETSTERETRIRREVQQNQERKRSGGGTNNSGPDSPGNSDGNGGDRGDDNGRGGDRDGDGDKDRGRSDGKSHGDNAGGRGRGDD
jgi:hypothetical protein